MKNFFFICFLTFFFPFFLYAQSPSVSYGHSSVTETTAVISGSVETTNLSLGIGYSLIFGNNPNFLINNVPIVLNQNGNFSITITNLLSNTEYFYKMIYGPLAVSVGPMKSFKTIAPSLILNHKDVTQDGARIYGTISTGHPEVIIRFGLSPKNLSLGSFSLNIQNGSFDQEFPKNFPPETIVYYAAAHPILPGVLFSNIKSFKTLEENINNFSFTNLTSTSVSVIGSVKSKGTTIKVLISKDGIYGNEIQNEPIIDEITGAWRSDFFDLSPNTEYYVRIAKKTDDSYTYLIKSFRTSSFDMDLQFSNITNASVRVSGTIPFAIDKIKICYAAFDPNNLNTSPNCGDGFVSPQNEFNDFEKVISNLAPNTTYYFVAKKMDNSNLTRVFDVTTFPVDSVVTPPVNTNINLPSGPSSLVPCEGLDCDFNSLLKLANNIINFLLKTIALPLFALLFFYIGWLFMTSSANPNQRSKAKSILKNSIIGFVIAMAAFVIIKTILVSLGYEGTTFLAF